MKHGAAHVKARLLAAYSKTSIVHKVEAVNKEISNRFASMVVLMHGLFVRLQGVHGYVGKMRRMSVRL